MKRLTSVAFILIALLIAGCTGSGTVTSTPDTAPSAKSPSFVLSDVGSVFVGGVTPFVVEHSFNPATGGYSVSVMARGAQDLKACAVELLYPTAELHVQFAEYAGGLGEDDALSLVLVRGGAVHMGAAIINGDVREGVYGDAELFKVEFAPGPAAVSKSVCKAPQGSENAVILTGSIDANNVVTIEWSELNRGDGDNNGTVNIADITPIAVNFSREVGSGATEEQNNAILLADYDNDGSVKISDITPIAVHFQQNLVGYDVEVREGPTGDFSLYANDPTPEDPTIARSEVNPSPGPTDGPLQYSFQTDPIEGVWYFRAVPVDKDGNDGQLSFNTLSYEGITDIVSMELEPPAGVDPWLVITEEAIDAVVGNEQPFARSAMQLTAMAMVEGKEEPVDVTNLVVWYIESGTGSATVGNDRDLNKGLVTGLDIGVVIITAYQEGDFTASASITLPVYAITDIILRVEGQADPADVSVPKGTMVDFEAIGIFDDNDAVTDDTLEIDLTPYVSWAIGRPQLSPGPPPVYEAGSFIMNTEEGWLITTDAGLQAGFEAFVTAVFPPEAVDPVIGEGFRANSNMVTVTLE
jgi:hypothetical protein